MAFLTMNYYSRALDTQTDVNIILPEKILSPAVYDQEGKFKCLYLLHGLGDDRSIWLRRTSIERYATKYNLCVVMPSGNRSFYTDMKHGANYYTFISKELPAFIREYFNVSDKREDHFIAGNSMGGYGALKAALRDCDTFSAGAGLSPCGDLKKLTNFNGIFKHIFGEDLNIPEDDDLLCLADKQKDNPNKPRLYITMGKNDFLYENIQELRSKLEANGYDFTYDEAEGGHDWGYWDAHIQEVLEWLING